MFRGHSQRFRAHVKTHEAIIDNEYWYEDGPPFLAAQFTAKKTAERQADVIDILLRAANRADSTGDRELAKRYGLLSDKLEGCRRHRRCGSMACPKCARATQRAKVDAEQRFIDSQELRNSGKYLVLLSLIPEAMTYEPGELHSIDIINANRWLKDTLDGLSIKRTTFGCPDFGWENRRGGNYFQLHWHLAAWTRHPARLKAQLKRGFCRARKYERPVDVEVTYDHDFLPYMNKVVKLPDLLRRACRQLPELLLTLDRFDPLDFMVLRGLRLSAQGRRIKLSRIRKAK
ncbi:MAG TPA: hypothetical protein VMU69_26890 [Bradyrhizobium sp.]|nr:hypothetical protein [Bradyrhizobium sp.]